MVQKLAKLRALLERVQSRGANGVAKGVASPAAVSAVAPAPVFPEAAVALAPAPAAPPVDVGPPPVAPAPVALREASYIDDGVDLPTWPPPPAPTNAPVVLTGEPAPPFVRDPEPEAEPDISIDVELSEPPPPIEPVAEYGRGSPVEDTASPSGSESVERLMAAPVSEAPAIDIPIPVESEPPPAVEERSAVAAAPEPDANGIHTSSEGRPPAFELDDPGLDADADGDEAENGSVDGPELSRAPASSRRPVAPGPEEPLADLAFDREELRPPRHTPPPESGRLPASPVEEFDADVTGVRTAPQPVESASATADAAEGGVGDAGSGLLVPEVIRAEFASSVTEVSDLIGAAQSFTPSTFAAWLDATLGL